MPAGRDTRDVLSSIDKGELAPIYCLVGEERFLIDRCLEALRTAVFGPTGAGADFNLDHFDLKERSLAAVLDSARTLPMFAKRRLVIARGLDELKSEDLEPLSGYLADPNPTTCLALVGGAKVDGRLKLFQAVKKAGYLHEFAHLRDWQLGDWLQAEARRRKLTLHPEAARLLAEAAGPDLGRMSLCLEQAALYAGADARVEPDHVQAVVPESRERGIFELTKAIGAGQRGQALRLLGNLLRNREPALRIQFMLMRQLRQIWRAKELQAAGRPPQRDRRPRGHEPPLPGRRAGASQEDEHQRAGAQLRPALQGRPEPEVVAGRSGHPDHPPGHRPDRGGGRSSSATSPAR